MGAATGFLVLKGPTIFNAILLSRIISTALQKVEQTLYFQVTNLKNLDTDVEKGNQLIDFSKIINQIYLYSAHQAPQIDTRVILQEYRNTLLGLQSDSSVQLSPKQPVDIYLTEEMLSSEQSDRFENPIHPSSDDQPQIPNLADPRKIYDNVVLGGTFDRLHTGHKVLLSAAVLRCRKTLTVGVTDGPMLNTKKLFELIEPFNTRSEKLREFLMDIEPRLQYKIVPIVDPYGPTAEDPNLEMLVVSQETLKGGQMVNALRNEKGLGLLDIHPVDLVADDFARDHEESKVSSSSLRKRLLGVHLKPPKSIKRPFIIGLTGGIASGKTSICNQLINKGAKSISCDHLGHQAYRQGSECYRQIVDYFGDSIINAEKEIDRKKLGPIVFSNKVHLEKLNSIVWPEIRRLYIEEVASLKATGYEGVIILDAAILLEAGWDQDCDEVWVSIVPVNEAVKRIVQRDALPPEQATKRIESQLSNTERVARANVVLCSVWEPHVTAQQVDTAWRQVQERLSKS